VFAIDAILIAREANLLAQDRLALGRFDLYWLQE
jgi:hypothetical protein